MTNSPFATIADFRDIESLNYFEATQHGHADPEALLEGLRYKGRDNARTPMQWDDSPHAGFTTGTPWIEANPGYTEINAAAQVDDPTSVFAHYQRLIALRHADPIVAHGSIEPLAMDHPDLWAYSRSYDGAQLLVLASFTRAPLRVPAELLDGWGGLEDLDPVLATSAEALVRDPDGSATLAGWESVVLCREVR